MMKFLIYLFTILFFVSCGGGGGGSSITSTSFNNNTLQARLIDSNVSGVDYHCRGYSGTTSKNGLFNYSIDCGLITFSIADLILDSIDAKDIPDDKKLYITDLVGVSRDDTNNPKVLKILQILQSLNQNSDPSNGILIPNNIKESFKNITFDINSSNENDIKILIKNTTNNQLISKEDAVAHFEKTLRVEENISINTLLPTFKIAQDENLTIYENNISVKRVIAKGVSQPITYSIDNTLDSSFFDINSTNGEITFKNIPDFEDQKREYDIKVKATDSKNHTVTKHIHIKLKNRFENIAKAQIKGGLSGATVEIIELNKNGSNRLISSQTTDNSGYFDAKRDDINTTKYYLYQVKGGIDTASNTINNGIIRTILKGSYIKDHDFIVSVASELYYMATIKSLIQRYEEFIKVKDREKRTILPNIKSDDELFSFIYKLDKDRLNSDLFPNIESKLSLIYSNKPNYLANNISSTIASKKQPNMICEAFTLNKNKDIAYVSYNARVQNSKNKIVVLNLSEKLNPTTLEEFYYEQILYDKTKSMLLSSDETKLYLLKDELLTLTLLIFDIDSDHKLRLLSQTSMHSLFSKFENMQLYNDKYLILSDHHNKKLRALYVDDPTNPREIGYDLELERLDYIEGDFVWSLCKDNLSCESISIKPSYELAIYNNFDKTGKATNTDLTDDILYVADGNLTLYDQKNHTESIDYNGSCTLRCSATSCSISTNSSCKKIKSYNYPLLYHKYTSGYAKAVVSNKSKNLIYLADSYDGFKIIDTNLYKEFTDYSISASDNKTNGVILYAPNSSNKNTKLITSLTKLEDKSITITIEGSIPASLVNRLDYYDVSACASDGESINDISCLKEKASQ